MTFISKKRRLGEDGYELWLRYPPVDDPERLAHYRNAVQQVYIEGDSPTLAAARAELIEGLEGLLDRSISLGDFNGSLADGALIVGTPQSSSAIRKLKLDDVLSTLGDEGYLLTKVSLEGKSIIAISANTDIGVLYGVFAFLRHLQTQKSLDDLLITSVPRTKYRMLNHWDNLDRTIERGYAGFSLWDWHKLPDYLAPRYIDYARANASIGINATVLTNANAHELILTRQYLIKIAALADVFRPYGLKVYLAVRFSSPIQLGGLKTADPLDEDVRDWWVAKANEIYALIPDFGGFVVKANSEGMPGPHDYGRSHSDGANMLAVALAPHGGIVSWRAFIYDDTNPDDRAKQAYTDLVPQDGLFRENVFLQVKNGAIDFQPREPFHPLFGAMPKTPLMLEVQITQEYLGHGTHLAYLAPMYKETLASDTYAHGTGSFVSKVIDGSLNGHTLTGMAAISNIGDERNWCGHPFGAANWYAYGRLAWDHTLTSEEIAEEWLRMTFSHDEPFLNAAKTIMMQSREAVVKYMTPLGLHHLMARSHHYGPGPWVEGGRADWTSVYYHQADSFGIGFDRTETGSNAVEQYFAPYRDQVANLETCPENLLLWFHHVAWNHRMKSGRTLWDELCHEYQQGLEMVREMIRLWDSIEGLIDPARFEHVQALLKIQEKDACWWRDACLLYFQTFSKLPIPAEVERASATLDAYLNRAHYYVPGIPETRFNRR